MRTQSILTITFDGHPVISRGEFFDGEEIEFPTDYPGDVINRVGKAKSPHVESYGNIKSSFSFSVVRDQTTPESMQQLWFDEIREWQSKGKGILRIESSSDSIAFEAIITSRNTKMKMIGGTKTVIIDYSFELGGEL